MLRGLASFVFGRFLSPRHTTFGDMLFPCVNNIVLSLGILYSQNVADVRAKDLPRHTANYERAREIHGWIYSVVQLSCTELKLTISYQARSIFNKDFIL